MCNVGEDLFVVVNIDGVIEVILVVIDVDLGKVFLVNVFYIDDVNYEENLLKSVDD